MISVLEVRVAYCILWIMCEYDILSIQSVLTLLQNISARDLIFSITSIKLKSQIGFYE